MTTVTKEMIGAAHDVMLAKGDFVLSAAMLERIYLAMEQAAPTLTHSNAFTGSKINHEKHKNRMGRSHL